VDLDFEARKDAAQVFGATVRIKDAEEKAPGAAYVLQRPYILNMLFQG
jgi:calcium binding protein 39